MRNPSAGPAYDPFPTETGGAGEADGGVNPRQLCPTFCGCPGIPRPLPGVQDQQALQLPQLSPAHPLCAEGITSGNPIPPCSSAIHPIRQEGKLRQAVV